MITGLHAGASGVTPEITGVIIPAAASAGPGYGPAAGLAGADTRTGPPPVFPDGPAFAARVWA